MGHSERNHALLSASGSSRWIHCTPSARLEELWEISHPSKPSVYASEGTLAHEIAELEVRKQILGLESKTYNSEFRKLKKNPLYYDEMPDEVQNYVDYIRESFNVAISKTPDAVLLVEERLDFSEWVEQGFGTGDSVIIADGIMEIVDLKFGRGIQVNSEKNSQLMLYGLGALNSYELMYDVREVKLTIIQPRLDHESSWSISPEELKKWAEEVVKPAAEKAYEGEGELVVGDHCKFCKVKASCPAYNAYNLEIAKMEFQKPELLTDEQVMSVFEQQPMIADWVNAVSEFMLMRALEGKIWKGYKLVEGRSNRKWKDEEEVLRIFESNKFKKSDYIQEKIIGIPKAEKLMTREKFSEILQSQVLKPVGAPTLVPESDKRIAMNGLQQAKIDFS